MRDGRGGGGGATANWQLVAAAAAAVGAAAAATTTAAVAVAGAGEQTDRQTDRGTDGRSERGVEARGGFKGEGIYELPEGYIDEKSEKRRKTKSELARALFVVVSPSV